MKISIGNLITGIAEFSRITLENNKEVDVSEYNIHIPIPGPNKEVKIQYVIKKDNLPGLALKLKSGHVVQCATNHILQSNNSDIFAKQLIIGNQIDTINGTDTIVEIKEINNATFYDIGIPYPHLYYDEAGIIHHNTVITTALSRSVEPYGRSLIIVPNRTLVTQTEKDYVNMGLDVGVFFGGKREYTKTHTICTWQSLNSLFKQSKSGEAQIPFTDFIKDVVCVIVDEAHMCKGDVLKSMLAGVMADIPIRWGLTGTIPKEEHAALELLVSIGPVEGKVSAVELQEKGILAQCNVNIKQLQDSVTHTNYQSELKYLLSNDNRLAYIATMIMNIAKTGNTLVLVDRVNAGKELEAYLDGKATFVSGATKAADRQEHYDDVGKVSDKILIATYGIAAVGVNIVELYNLVLIEPGKSFVRVIQSIGRGLRVSEDKKHAEIWDITSSCRFAKRHLTQRKKYYSEVEYPYKVEKVHWE